MDTNPSKIVVYHCRNLQLFPKGKHKEFGRAHPGIKLVMTPCSGKVEAHHLLNTLASGAQGVLVLACAETACRFMEGSMRSHKRTDYAREWLRKLGIETERVRFVHVPPRDVTALERLLEDFSKQLDAFGTLPAA
jgi:coenzyme F420-reducing hydrogenase delta subunit